VRVRARFCAVGARFRLFFLCLAALYAATLIAARLLGLLPDVLHPVTLPGLAAGAMALAIAFSRRPAATGAARLVDGKTASRDLFLTACLIQDAAGEYKPLVLKAAEVRAAGLRPRDVLPLRWWPKAAHVVLACAALLAGVLYLPQLDPFGRGEQRRLAAERREQLAAARRATELRLAMLREKDVDARLSKEVDSALQELKQTFQQAKPANKEANLRSLQEHRQELGKLWREAAQSRPAPSPGSFERQKFGTDEGKQAEQWREDLRKGDASGIKNEMRSVQEAVRRLKDMPDGPEKDALAEQVRRRLEEFSKLAEQGLNSPSLSAALQRAMDQMAEAGLEGLSAESLKALQDSLELSQAEVESLAQALRDLKALEEALAALQMARRLNDWDALDCERTGQCKTMGDYAALYAQLVSGRCSLCGAMLNPDGACPNCGALAGRGMGGPLGGEGIGRGGKAPEAPGIETDHTPEQSRSDLVAGKILLSLKGKGSGEPGQARLDYQQYVAAVKQGVSEAIVHEQVPPAYHDAVRRYFDTLGGADAEATP
jgi:hypothetical protein